MAIHVGVGTSESLDAFLAGKEAARDVCQKAQEDFLDLLIVFASVKFDQQSLLLLWLGTGQADHVAGVAASSGRRGERSLRQG